MSFIKLGFSVPYAGEDEFEYMKKAYSNMHLSGDGQFTKKCNEWIKEKTNCNVALLTNSCTASLEMSAILMDICPGDEVIMPSYTFVSTANAFVLRGAIPVFVDIRYDTLNINELLIESAITDKTRAIVVVHYAGVSCEMDTILSIANKHSIPVIEDAAQGIMSYYKDRHVGSLGSLGTLSFHETKNIMCGEGGALLINDEKLIERAEIIREKGTNRKKFLMGEVDKYTWVDIGSSFLPSELSAAFLWAQFEKSNRIQKHRLYIWNLYYDLMGDLEKAGLIRRPIVPEECLHNGHIFYIIVNKKYSRGYIIQELKRKGILSVFHYSPLHNSPAGKKYGRVGSVLEITQQISDRLIRLPIHFSMDKKQVLYVVNSLKEAFNFY